jgi:uncharacterized protein YceK
MSKKLALGFGLLLLLSGCASLAEMDQSLVNHPAMDLHTRLTPERASYLTILDNNSQGKASGCLNCAH